MSNTKKNVHSKKKIRVLRFDQCNPTQKCLPSYFGGPFQTLSNMVVQIHMMLTLPDNVLPQKKISSLLTKLLVRYKRLHNYTLLSFFIALPLITSPFHSRAAQPSPIASQVTFHRKTSPAVRDSMSDTVH